MRIVFGLAIVALAGASAGAAQAPDAAVLTGRWAGLVDEPGGEPARYPIRLTILLDINRAPLGIVRYDALGCSGNWLEAEAGAHGWRFREVITDDPDHRCAPRMAVEVDTSRGGLMVRWSDPDGGEPIATARLGLDARARPETER